MLILFIVLIVLILISFNIEDNFKENTYNDNEIVEIYQNNKEEKVKNKR